MYTYVGNMKFTVKVKLKLITVMGNDDFIGVRKIKKKKLTSKSSKDNLIFLSNLDLGEWHWFVFYEVNSA